MQSSSPLDNVRIVLTRTTHPGNIGGAARAMKTMGLARLFLVAPKEFPSREANARAVGAIDVVERARACTSLDEALRGTIFAVACTGRKRDLSLGVAPARQAAAELIEQARLGEVALVFGPEASGLSNAEVDLCQ